MRCEYCQHLKGYKYRCASQRYQFNYGSGKVSRKKISAEFLLANSQEDAHRSPIVLMFLCWFFFSREALFFQSNSKGFLMIAYLLYQEGISFLWFLHFGLKNLISKPHSCCCYLFVCEANNQVEINVFGIYVILMHFYYYFYISSNEKCCQAYSNYAQDTTATTILMSDWCISGKKKQNISTSRTLHFRLNFF